jgi:hypothetical protein
VAWKLERDYPARCGVKRARAAADIRKDGAVPHRAGGAAQAVPVALEFFPPQDFPEGAMSQATPRHHLGELLRAAQDEARRVDATRAAAYHRLPPGIACQADWAGWADPFYEATPRQQALLDVLQDLLDGGEAQLPALARQAARRLRLPAGEFLRRRDDAGEDGAGGSFHDDVLHALFLLEAQETERVFYGLMDRLVQPTGIRLAPVR